MRWLLLQLADSSFPAGGFAHSGGLEAAAQQGEVSGAAELVAFACQALYQAGHAALPLVNSAYAFPERLAEWDARCHVFLSNHVSNRASRNQGRAFLSACEKSFPSAGVLELSERARAQKLGCHYAPLFGSLARALELSRREAQELFLFLTLRGTLSAAVRLGIVGPFQAQQMQRELTSMLEAVLARCGDLKAHDLAQTAPRIDLIQSTHDRLYSRLFQA